MRPSACYFGSACVALLLFASPAQGQSAQKWSVQASGLFVGVFGDAYDGLKNGPGLEAQVRYTPSVWSFGGGFQSSWHDLDLEDLGTESVSLAGVFVEPRRVFDVGSATSAPYLSARLAFLQQSVDVNVDGTTVSASASGVQVNVGGGVLMRLSPRVNLDLGATFGAINFGDVVVEVPGAGSTAVSGSSGTGQNLVLRAGLAIGIGK